MTKDLQAKIIKTIDNEYESMSSGLKMLKNAFDKGRFAFLLSKIDIIDQRLDNLQQSIIASTYSDFGLAQILGFFLAPALANIVVQPVFQLALNRIFKKSSANYNIFKGQSLELKGATLETYINSYGKILKSSSFQIHLSNKESQENLDFLYGAITDATVGGFINDSSQNIINYGYTYKEKKEALQYNSLRTKSIALSVLLAQIDIDLDRAIINIEKVYRETRDIINKGVKETDEKYWNKYIDEVNKFNKKFERELIESFNNQKSAQGHTTVSNVTSGDLIEIMIVNAHNLIWSLYLGTSINGEVKITQDYPLSFRSDGNLSKEVIDYLIQNIPSPRNSFIEQEIRALPELPSEYKTKYKDKNELLERLIKYYIDNTQEGKLLDEEVFKSPNNNEVKVSLYTRAAYRMSRWFMKSYLSMNKVSEGVINNLTTLSTPTKAASKVTKKK